MKAFFQKIWPYLAAFFAGLSAGLILMANMLKKSISNNKIEIQKPKIKNSPDGNQDFVNEIKSIPDERKIERQKRKLFNLKQNGKKRANKNR